MKFLLSVCLLLMLQINTSARQLCDDFEIIAIYDFPPSPSTPGGNYFLMLLALKPDAQTQFSPFYADIYFQNEQGDTLSIPFGPNVTLPSNPGDTIPYIMQLNTQLNNQDFPKDFNGFLLIKFSDLSTCEMPYSNDVSNVLSLGGRTSFKVFPNPGLTQVSVETDQTVLNWTLWNSQGATVKSNSAHRKTFKIDLSRLTPGNYFLLAELEDGSFLSKKIVKANY